MVETSGFLDGRRVLISPVTIREVDGATKRILLALTMDAIKEDCPRINWDEPVTRRHELNYFGQHPYPRFWGSSWMKGTGNARGLLPKGRRSEAQKDFPDKFGDVHLRRASEVRGCTMQGSDEAIGRVEDLIVDDEIWAIRYLVINTSSWLFGKKVLIAPHWATGVSWEDQRIDVTLSRQVVKDSPEWDPTDVIGLEFEALLYKYYGRPGYWHQVPPPHHLGKYRNDRSILHSRPLSNHRSDREIASRPRVVQAKSK